MTVLAHEVTSGAVVITGGAGYIGSHTVLACRAVGRPVVVLDDLSRGNRRLLPADVPFYEGDAGDPSLLATIVRSEEHTSELQPLMRISYAVFCLKNKTTILH